MVSDTFVAKPKYPTPFPPGRFGNGQWPVYYAALAEETCASEVAYHLTGQAVEGRYYSVVSCRFRGDVLNLVGEQNRHPDLVSPTDAGYPFCQQVADEARSVVSGLHAPSARHTGGVCIPVLDRQSLSQPQVSHRGRFVSDVGTLKFETI
ncbi:RES family NAD+ phosphorylase [Bradyrhizobium barranii]|uniref:RES family NAD+ phosphorylase n=1 Tax=Bradyrhizobium barranii TaxID=2992140 RepID=UPI001CCD66D3